MVRDVLPRTPYCLSIYAIDKYLEDTLERRWIAAAANSGKMACSLLQRVNSDLDARGGCFQKHLEAYFP